VAASYWLIPIRYGIEPGPLDQVVMDGLDLIGEGSSPRVPAVDLRRGAAQRGVVGGIQGDSGSDGEVDDDRCGEGNPGAWSASSITSSSERKERLEAVQHRQLGW
jgi:hypothetical protein